jgi:hypothetical protein
MNHYGLTAMSHWRNLHPTRYASLDDPQAFFRDLGEQIASEVSNLAGLIANRTPAREDYLQEVARLQQARRQAEEVVMNQLVWEGDLDLSLGEARTEWASVSASWENLIRWVERLQEDEITPLTVEIEDTARLWAVPATFIEQMLAAENPRAVFRENEALIREASALRFLREVH